MNFKADLRRMTSNNIYILINQVSIYNLIFIKYRLEFEYYRKNELILKNMYIVGRSHTDFPLHP